METHEGRKAMPMYPSQEHRHEAYFPKDATPLAYEGKTIYDYLFGQPDFNPSLPAFNYLDTRISYGKFKEECNRTAAALASLGVKRGDMVAVIMPSIPEVFYLVYALSRIGATANMIDVRYPTNGFREQIELTGSKVLFAFDGVVDRIAPLVEEGAIDTVVLVSPSRSVGPRSLLKNKTVRKAFFQGLGKKESTPSFPHMTWDEFIAQTGSVQPEYAFEPNTPVVAVSTGGTTGTPKKVLLTNENFSSSVHLVRRMGFDFQQEQTWYVIMPPVIAYGLVNGLHLPLCMGMEVILVPDPNSISVAQEFIKYRPQHVTGTANHWEDVIQSPLSQNQDFSFLLDPTCGGDHVNPKLESDINGFFAAHGSRDKLRVGYGLTECGGGCCCFSKADQVVSQSVGFPFPEAVVAAFRQKDDGSFEELPYAPESAMPDDIASATGELCITGPHVMLGYCNNPEEAAKVLVKHNDGRTWLHTGDAGYIGSRGEVFVTGRIKDFIVSASGFKIPPKEIEDIVCKSPHVRKAKAVGYPDDAYSQGELACVFVVLEESCDKSWEQVVQELRSLCASELPDYKQPARYELIDALPLTPIGKVDVRRLRKGLKKDSDVKRID